MSSQCMKQFASSNPTNGQSPPNDEYYFPTGTPYWSIPRTAKPAGSNPHLSTWTTEKCKGGGKDALTLSNLDVPGEYDVYARCSEFDGGDNIHVIAVEPKLEYNDPINGWTDITSDPPTTIYVCQGTTVNFRAVTNPSGATWPDQKPVWKYNGNPLGDPGETDRPITFTTLSTSTTDYKTVSVECGKTVTVNVIVYNFVANCVPNDNFINRSYVHFGVCEHFDLYCNILPSGLTAEQVGKLSWNKDVYSQYATFISRNENTGNGEFKASNIANTDYIWCEVQSGPSAGVYQDFTLPVIQPDGGYCYIDPSSNIYHEHNYYSIGIATYMFLTPTDVSFAWIGFKECSCNPTSCTGWFASSPHDFSNEAHNEWNVPVPVGWGDKNWGSRIIMEYYWPYDPHDYAQFAYISTCLPYSDGYFKWNIPWKYYDPNPPYTSLILIGNMNQESHVYDGNGDGGYNYGDATIQKDGEGPWQNTHGGASLPYF